MLALFAAVGFGTFFAAMDRAEETADVAWVLLAARTADVGVLLVACALLRPPLPRDAASLAGDRRDRRARPAGQPAVRARGVAAGCSASSACSARSTPW